MKLEDREKIVDDFHKSHPQAMKDNTHWFLMRNDHLALLEIIDKFQIKSIFEIGTWEGLTAGIMCKMPSVKRYVALDICDENNVAFEHVVHHVSPKERYGKYAKDSKKFSIIFEDSRKFEPKEDFDMVFVDADHSYEGVKNDTELAFKMNPRIVVWHDYGSEPGVIQFINELKEDKKIIGFSESLVVYYDNSLESN